MTKKQRGDEKMEQTSNKRIQIKKAIQFDYGTVKRFCRIHDINYATWDVVMNGTSKSARITDLLIDKGYLKHADELIREKA